MPIFLLASRVFCRTDPYYLFPKSRKKWEQATPAVIRMSKHTSIVATRVTLLICSICCLLRSENLTAVTERDLFSPRGLMPDFVLNFILLFSGAGRFILCLKISLAALERFMLMAWWGVHPEVGSWKLLSALLWQFNSSYNLFVLTLVLYNFLGSKIKICWLLLKLCLDNTHSKHPVLQLQLFNNSLRLGNFIWL